MSLGLQEFDLLAQMDPEAMSSDPQAFSTSRQTNTPAGRVLGEVHNGDIFMGYSTHDEESQPWLEMEDFQEQSM